MKRVLISLVVPALLGGLVPVVASAQELPSGQITDLPVSRREVPRGQATYAQVNGPAPAPKTIDGDPSDWVGRPPATAERPSTRPASTSIRTTSSMPTAPTTAAMPRGSARTDQLEEAVPEAYRIDALAQADPAGEFGVPVPERVLLQRLLRRCRLRIRTPPTSPSCGSRSGDGGSTLLARTTTMNAASDTALLLLADTVPGETAERTMPFNTNLTTTNRLTSLFFIANGSCGVADLATGRDDALSAGAAAAANASGWTTRWRHRIPLARLCGVDGSVIPCARVRKGRTEPGRIRSDHSAIEPNENPDANVANVAFRFDEPVRMWFEKSRPSACTRAPSTPSSRTSTLAKLNSGGLGDLRARARLPRPHLRLGPVDRRPAGERPRRRVPALRRLPAGVLHG